MRKSVLVGLGLAFALAGTAAAQQAGQDDQRRPRAERGQKEARRDRDGRGPHGLLLRDITLSESQKTQLRTLREAQRDRMEGTRDQMAKQREEIRTARERGDTAAVRAILQRNRQAMEQARAQELTAIRTILTAEQRVQFDKNVAELEARRAERGDRFGPGARGPRGGRGDGAGKPFGSGR